MADAVKICCDCGAEKALSEFHADKRKPDSRRSECKDCRNWLRKVLSKSLSVYYPFARSLGKRKAIGGN
jgi:hypothetical protein